MGRFVVTTAAGSVGEPERWLPFLARELGAAEGFVVVDSESDHSYVQARNHGAGVLVMEYRDGSPQRHFQAWGVGLDDVAELFEQWVQGERSFADQHEWRRLTDWDDPPEQQAL